MSITLTLQQSLELVDKLLACPSFQSASDRQIVGQQLSRKIKEVVSLGAISTPKEETLALVTACLNVENGLADLIETVGFFDANTVAFDNLETYITRLMVVSEPQPTLNLPYRNPRFIGREKELKELYNTLTASNTVALVALHGLGGIGKTSLALEYCYLYKTEYDFIAWLSADNVPLLRQEFLALADGLGLPQLPTDTVENQQYLINMVKHKLGTVKKHWLLVFDNAEQLEDIEPLLPDRPSTKGHVIITSRNKQMVGLTHFYPQSVNLLTEDAALALLVKYCQPHIKLGEQGWENNTELTAAKELVEELGYLSLAIVQAGTYIYNTGCLVREYLTLFQKTSAELFRTELAKPKDYPMTVATTWELAFIEISQQSSGAADLLSMLAFFAPDNIRIAWFTTQDEKIKGELPESIAELTNNIHNLNIALALLQKYSLLERESEYLRIHPLVQLITRQKLAQTLLSRAKISDFDSSIPSQPEQMGKVSAFTYWFNQSVAFLLASFPDTNEYRNLADSDELISHLKSLINHYNQVYQAEFSESAQLTNSSTFSNGLDWVNLGTLFVRAAEYYYYRAFYVEAKSLFEQALTITEKALGSEHIEVGIILGNLVLLLLDIGDYEAARLLFERIIVISEKTLGNDHPALATSLNNLAGILQATGDYTAAKPLYERAIAITEKVMGSEHPDTASMLNNLATLHRAAGNYEAARPLFERVIAITEKTLGNDHPSMANALNNLAGILQATGDYTAAKPLYERAIAITEKVMGSEHPDTASMLNNLATLLLAIGDYEAARPLFERVIAITEKTLGNDHPSMASMLNNLATLHRAAGNYEAARPLFERVIVISEKTLGNDHPSMANALNNLATLLLDVGNYEAARPLFERAIAISEKTLGNDHPALATSLNNFGWYYYELAEYKLALTYFQKALTIRQVKLGEAHFDTKDSVRAIRTAEAKLDASNSLGGKLSEG